MGTAGPLRQPIPVARSILWSPAGEDGGGQRPGHLPFPVFLAQSALTAIHEHVAAPARPGQGVLGFLFGDLCECPETNVSYLVIDAALRLNQAIYGDRTRDVITRLWDRVQEQLETQHAHLIGWYHTHPRRSRRQSRSSRPRLRSLSRPHHPPRLRRPRRPAGPTIDTSSSSSPRPKTCRRPRRPGPPRLLVGIRHRRVPRPPSRPSPNRRQRRTPSTAWRWTKGARPHPYGPTSSRSESEPGSLRRQRR